MKTKIFKLTSLNVNAFFIALVFSMSSTSVIADSSAKNLIKNPGAEASPGSVDGSVVKVKNWRPTGDFTAVKYGKPNTPYLVRSNPPIKGSGKNFFAGGPKNALSSAVQIINIASLAKTVDSESVIFRLSGFFGGWQWQNDNAVLTAEFRNAAKQSISQVSIGGVQAAERKNITSLIFRKFKDVIPKGTRSIKLILTMMRTDGVYNDGYAENLSLVLTKKSGS